MATSTAQNRTLFQSFEWHTLSSPPGPNESFSPRSHYTRLTRLLPTLSHLGVTSVWLPPGCKAMNRQGNGYDIYDLWDLGEFDQKGTRATKWGSIEELRALLKAANELGLDVIWDTVLNHKAGADRTSEVWAVEVDKKDRRFEIASPKKIEAWLQFDFPGRKGAAQSYSPMKWEAEHFNGTDWDHRSRKDAIYKLISDPATHPLPENVYTNSSARSLAPPQAGLPSTFTRARSRDAVNDKQRDGRPAVSSRQPPRRPGKGWADDVDDQNGNNDYLMFTNVDFAHPDVRRDILKWGEWLIDTIALDGFRLDAVQHVSYTFVREWIRYVDQVKQKRTGRGIFVVGELWSGEVERITKWLDAVQQPSGQPRVHAFDAPLLYNFSRLSEAITEKATSQAAVKKQNTSQALKTAMPDLRTLLNNSLLLRRPNAAVTVVTNHDTQPGQPAATPMDHRLKPLFYAFTLLRRNGLPCVFWGDLFGTQGPKAETAVGVSSRIPTHDNPAADIRRSQLADLMMCRKLFAYGSQTDYWDSPSSMGWTRSGTVQYGGCAVVLSIESPSSAKVRERMPALPVKHMQIGRPGEVWFDVLGHTKGAVTIDQHGYGAFPAYGVGVSVFVRHDSPGVQNFPVTIDLNVYGV